MILFKNGNIQTMDSTLPQGKAMVVEGNKFVYVGTEDGAREYLNKHGQADKEIDLEGRLVIPGLNDSHMHFIHLAKSLRSVDLVGTKSIDEVKNRIKHAMDNRDKEDTTWLEGEGWNHDYFEDEKRFPNKFDLDGITGDVPTIIMRACFHIGVLNTAAMNEIGLNKETAKEYGNLVELLPNGEPNGVIKESLLEKVKAMISKLTLDITKEIIVAAQDKLFEAGITSVQTDDIGYMPNRDYDLFFQALDELEKEEKLKVRIGEQCLFEDRLSLEEFFKKGYGEGWGRDKYKITSIKLLSDGSLGARTAALRNPYADDSSTKGIALFKQEDLDELVMISHDNNCPVAIHAIGDGAIEMSLNAIEKAQKKNPNNDLRHGIVHCQITDEGLLNCFRELNVTAFIQPIFIDYDMNIIVDRVGNDLAETSYAWKTMKEKGIHMPFGTDCPVESFNPMANIYTAVTRKNITGNSKNVYLPNEKLSMSEAIYAYTVEGAYASGEEKIKGTITKDKFADFVVMDRDLFNLSCEEDILDAKVMKTYVDGKLVHERL
ncbi:amidohydrolase [Tissierella praeacuta]|uniref:amidohydrolase n=1 Tax=Tissierella praeacuta TaxID=43131 RepID=UPI0033409438